jgi:hypothetical protein
MEFVAHGAPLLAGSGDGPFYHAWPPRPARSPDGAAPVDGRRVRFVFLRHDMRAATGRLDALVVKRLGPAAAR